MLAHPRALIIAGLAVATFLLVPGFPKWVFASLSIALIATGLLARRTRERLRTLAWISHRDAGDGDGDSADEADAPQAISAPLAVRVASDLQRAIDRHALDRQLARVKTSVETDLGPVFPRLDVAHAANLLSLEYEVLVDDVAVSRGRLRPGW